MPQIVPFFNYDYCWLNDDGSFGGFLSHLGVPVSTAGPGGGLLPINNLSDVASPSSARANLGLGAINNTSDANKPASDAVLILLNGKQTILATPPAAGKVLMATGNAPGAFSWQDAPGGTPPDGSITMAKLAPNAVGAAQLAQIATRQYLGRTTAGTGNVENVPIANLASDLATLFTQQNGGTGGINLTATNANKSTKVSPTAPQNVTVDTTGCAVSDLFPIYNAGSANVTMPSGYVVGPNKYGCDEWEGGVTFVSTINPASAGSSGADPITVTGSSVNGSTLTAAISAGWQNTGGNWTRDGANISGATALTYATVSADGTHLVTYKSANIPFIPVGVNVAAVSTPAPAFTAQSAPAGSVGSAYTYTFVASNTTSFSVSSGALPSGVTLNAATGVISGTPTAPGAVSFTITATGPGGSTASVAQSFSITSSSGTLFEATFTGSDRPIAGETPSVSNVEGITFDCINPFDQIKYGAVLVLGSGLVAGTLARITSRKDYTILAQGVYFSADGNTLRIGVRDNGYSDLNAAGSNSILIDFVRSGTSLNVGYYTCASGVLNSITSIGTVTGSPWTTNPDAGADTNTCRLEVVMTTSDTAQVKVNNVNVGSPITLSGAAKGMRIASSDNAVLRLKASYP